MNVSILQRRWLTVVLPIARQFPCADWLIMAESAGVLKYILRSTAVRWGSRNGFSCYSTTSEVNCCTKKCNQIFPARSKFSKISSYFWFRFHSKNIRKPREFHFQYPCLLHLIKDEVMLLANKSPHSAVFFDKLSRSLHLLRIPP